MRKPKIAIIGVGTGGCVSTSLLSRNPNLGEINWFFNPDHPAQSVGEGTTPFFPDMVAQDLKLTYPDLNKIDSTIKTGIRKINWGGTGDFIHNFILGQLGLHFNASKYQELCVKTLPKKGVKIIPKEVHDYTNIDADYIMDCSGTPKDYSEYNEAKHIPVNSAHIVQCSWEKPEFNYTLTIARPYGWVFGIPLQNRCSIGYLYNKNINTLEEVKEDIKEVFKQFNLTPTTKTNSLTFNNYYKKENFTSRVSYNGNASFFLEPMEATSIGSTFHNAQLFDAIISKTISVEEANLNYTNIQEQIQAMIMLHYLAGSRFKTPFWEFAQTQARECLSKKVQENHFKDTFFDSYKYLNPLNSSYSPLIPQKTSYHDHPYGTWNSLSFYENMVGLDLYDKINLLIKK